MCLTNIHFDKTKVKDKVYKVLKIVRNYGVPTLLLSENHNYNWKPGYNSFVKKTKANKTNLINFVKKCYKSFGKREADIGIHVFLNKRAAQNYCRTYETSIKTLKVVEFTVYHGDILVVGRNNKRTSGAVVAGLTLSKEEYKRVIG